MKEISQQIFKNTYLKLCKNYRNKDYIISTYYDKYFNEYISILSLITMNAKYYINEANTDNNDFETKRLNYGYDD